VEITEVRIKLMEDSEDRLRAFCSVTFDHCFVVRDLKIIEGTSGLFVAMPSRKMMARCRRCGCKNHLRSRFCNSCGVQLSSGGQLFDEGNPNKLYADIAHPINQQCRDAIQQAVMGEYELECRRAGEPGYASRYDDGYEETAAALPRSPDEAWVRIDPEQSDLRPPAVVPQHEETAPESSTELRSPQSPPPAQPADGRSDTASGINPPHHPPSHSRTGTPHSSSSTGGEDAFGAGIFDEPS
jgi:stage V sporulation protein G